MRSLSTLPLDATFPTAIQTSVDNNTRHSGGSNVIFMDGHVKWYRSMQAYNNWEQRVWAGGCGWWGNGRR